MRCTSCLWIWKPTTSSWISRSSTASHDRASWYMILRTLRASPIEEGDEQDQEERAGLCRRSGHHAAVRYYHRALPAVSGPATTEPLQLQVSTLAYDDYIGRLGIGRITKGVIKAGQTVAVAKGRRSASNSKKINQVFVYRGLKRMAVDQAECRRHRRDLRYCGHLHRRDHLRPGRTRSRWK